MRHLIALVIALTVAAPAFAGTVDDKTRKFVSANLIAIFYHELGHALIDIMKLPIFGQEEDAADVLSVVLIDALFNEDVAQSVAYDTAHGFLGDVKVRTSTGGDVAYWDVHGPDLQRFYTFVCLFYGGNPDERGDFARDFELPEGRQYSCEEEFQQAKNSWGPVIDGLVENGAGRSIRFLADHRVDMYGKLAGDVLAKEVAIMNGDLSLPKRLLVRVETCDTVNAFYSPKAREIIMCTEFARYLADLTPK